MALHLLIGDKTYSSWSLRAALALQLTGAPYSEQLIRLRQPDTLARILEHSPTGKVPVLLTEEGPVWDSLAIGEYLAERFPEAHLWPRGQYPRAVARSACAEMHSGFVTLRTHLPMDLKRDQALAPLPGEEQSQLQAELQRLFALWAECRSTFGADGPFLFGLPSLADVFFAPVATRLRNYRVDMPAEAAAYVETIHQWPAFVGWYQAAQQES